MTDDPTPRREDQAESAQDVAEPESERSAGPGERLREQRQSRGLTVEQAAQELRVSARIVSALEDNDFAILQAPIFVRGHLKNYARLLDLPEGEVVKAYDQTLPKEVEFEPRANKTEGPVLNHGTPRWIFPVAWLVILIMLVMGGLWWYAGPHRESLATLDNDANEGLATLEQNEQSGANDAPESRVSPLETSLQLDLPDNLPVRGGGDSEADSSEPVAGGLEQEVAEALDERLPEAPEAADFSSDSDDGEPESVEPDLAPDLELRLLVESDSWLEIRDSRGQQLFYGMAREGRELALAGVSPIELFMGNAPAIQLEADGEAVDFSDRIRGDNTARVVVPAQ